MHHHAWVLNWTFVLTDHENGLVVWTLTAEMLHLKCIFSAKMKWIFFNTRSMCLATMEGKIPSFYSFMQLSQVIFLIWSNFADHLSKLSNKVILNVITLIAFCIVRKKWCFGLIKKLRILREKVLLWLKIGLLMLLFQLTTPLCW